jgi:hypothetical protein
MSWKKEGYLSLALFILKSYAFVTQLSKNIIFIYHPYKPILLFFWVGWVIQYIAKRGDIQQGL